MIESTTKSCQTSQTMWTKPHPCLVFVSNHSHLSFNFKCVVPLCWCKSAQTRSYPESKLAVATNTFSTKIENFNIIEGPKKTKFPRSFDNFTNYPRFCVHFYCEIRWIFCQIVFQNRGRSKIEDTHLGLSPPPLDTQQKNNFPSVGTRLCSNIVYTSYKFVAFCFRYFFFSIMWHTDFVYVRIWCSKADIHLHSAETSGNLLPFHILYYLKQRREKRKWKKSQLMHVILWSHAII